MRLYHAHRVLQNAQNARSLRKPDAPPLPPLPPPPPPPPPSPPPSPPPPPLPPRRPCRRRRGRWRRMSMFQSRVGVAAARAAAAGTAAARAGVAAANFVVQCSYLENHGHFVVHSWRTHSVWLKRTESEHYYTPRRPLHSDLENVRLSTTSDTDGRHQTCAPLFSLPCMLVGPA